MVQILGIGWQQQGEAHELGDNVSAMRCTAVKWTITMPLVFQPQINKDG